MTDPDKTNEEINGDAPSKRRGRPKKRVQEELADTTAKRRGRPKKSETTGRPTAVHRERPTELVFALDIGTRSVIGIVAEQREGLLHILVFFELYYLSSLLGGAHQRLQVNLEII